MDIKKINQIALLALFCAGTVCNANAQKASTVHIYGQLLDMGTREVPLKFDGAASLVGDSRNILLHTDAEGRFDTIINLKEPTYYSICRNTMYLTPGDDLKVKITQNNQEAEFSGKGAEVNNYMKFRLFPKGGSFLEGGSNVRKDFASTKALIDSLATVRREQLNALTGATKKFKELEGARITGDVLNSYLCYASYSRISRNVKTSEEFMQKADSFYQTITPYVKPLFAQLAKDEYLDVAVVRGVLEYLNSPESATQKKWAEGINMTNRMKELYGTTIEVSKLRTHINEEVLNKAKAYAASLKNADFAAELNEKIAQAGKLVKGQPAIDFEMVGTDGKTYHLSDFKGKTLYLDFWATWCGPCIQESPYFEAMAKEMKDKDITFIPISMDTNKKAWQSFITAHKKELPQYNSTDEVLSSGWIIYGIPRFVVIDKDFHIVNAFAPRPSEDAAKKLLLGL